MTPAGRVDLEIAAGLADTIDAIAAASAGRTVPYGVSQRDRAIEEAALESAALGRASFTDFCELVWGIQWWGKCEAERTYLTGLVLAGQPPAPAPPNREPVKLPKLTPATRRRYISAVTQGMADGSITPPRGRALLFAAQLSLGDQAIDGKPPKAVKDPARSRALEALARLGGADSAG